MPKSTSSKTKQETTVPPIVPIETTPTVETSRHPMDDILGTYEGEIWEDILKNIKRNRRAADRLANRDEQPSVPSRH